MISKIDKSIIAAVETQLASSKLKKEDFPGYNAVKQIIAALQAIADSVNAVVDEINNQ